MESSEQIELMSKNRIRGIETWKGRGRDWLKEGEGTSQRTCVHGPWTWTTVWGLPVGVGARLGGGVKEENCDNCNSINNKIFLNI